MWITNHWVYACSLQDSGMAGYMTSLWDDGYMSCGVYELWDGGCMSCGVYELWGI